MEPLLRSTLSIVPVRSEPSDKSEMETQILYGEAYKILEEKEKWVKVEIIYDSYQGWIDRNQIGEYSIDSFGIVTDPFKSVNTENGSLIVSIGAEQKGSFHEKQEVVSTAKKYLNTPYLWGGKSIFGIDCSGFTQQVFKQCGVKLPRDAYQQADLGLLVEFENCQEKDVAYFDTQGRITHVGIVLEGGKIIHASGKVRIDQLTAKGIINTQTKELTHSLAFIKRLKIPKSI